MESFSYNRLFSWKGRSNQNQFLISAIIFELVIIITFFLSEYAMTFLGAVDQRKGVLISIFYIILLLIGIRILVISAIKRLHDLGLSKFFALIVLIPIINGVFGIFLIFKTGIHRNTSHGAYEPNNRLLFVGLFLTLIAIVYIFNLFRLDLIGV